METKKIDWIVSLRAIAALAVILHHVSSGWIEGSGGHPEGYRAILDVILVPLLSWWGVPIFIMISGYLLLDPKKDIPLCKLGKYIRRMLVILCTFGLAFAFVEVGFKIGFSHIGYVFQQAIYKLFCGESWAHMWYIYMLLGLYCILPAMKTFTAKASYEEMLFVAGALFIFCSIVPSINCYLDWKLNNILPVKTVYVLYFLIGYLIKVKNISKRLCDTFIVLGGVGLIVHCAHVISGQYLWPSNDNIFVFLYSVGIFSYIAQSHVFDTMGKLSAIKEISELSLGIYILHPVVLNFLNKFLKIYPDSLPLVVGEFVFWVAAFVGAYVMTKLCCRIPKLGKYL